MIFGNTMTALEVVYGGERWCCLSQVNLCILSTFQFNSMLGILALVECLQLMICFTISFFCPDRSNTAYRPNTKTSPPPQFSAPVGLAPRRNWPFCCNKPLACYTQWAGAQKVRSSCQRRWLVVGCHGDWRSRQSVVFSASLACREMAASWGFRGKL